MKIIKFLLAAAILVGLYSCDQAITDQEVTFVKEVSSIQAPVANQQFSAPTFEISIADADQEDLTSMIEKAELKTITIEVTAVNPDSKFIGDIKYSKSTETSGKILIDLINEPLDLNLGNTKTYTIEGEAATEIGEMIVSEEPIKIYIDGKASVATVFSLKVSVVANLTLNALNSLEVN